MSEHRDLLSCGHEPSPHGAHTTGTARRSDGSAICWTCADREQRDALKTAQTYTAYLTHLKTDDGYVKASILTTWTGGHLANVTRLWQTRIGGFLGRQTIYRFRATDVHGQQWYGTSPGPGMYARMHRAKG